MSRNFRFQVMIFPFSSVTRIPSAVDSSVAPSMESEFANSAGPGFQCLFRLDQLLLGAEASGENDVRGLERGRFEQLLFILLAPITSYRDSRRLRMCRERARESFRTRCREKSRCRR